jgi:hypothetical protein
MNTHTHSKNSNTIKSSSFIAISNSYEVVLILRPWDHVNHWNEKGTFMISGEYKGWFGYSEILVEAHGSRVEFV